MAAVFHLGSARAGRVGPRWDLAWCYGGDRDEMLLPRWTRIVLFGIAGGLVVSPAPAGAQAAGVNGPGSLARIRAALEEPPPRLQVPPPSTDLVPTFRVEVNQFLSLAPVDEEPFDPTWGLPSAGELMMGGIGKLRSAVSGYKKRRAQRRAKQEVSDALEEFCAVHACPARETK